MSPTLGMALLYSSGAGSDMRLLSRNSIVHRDWGNNYRCVDHTSLAAGPLSMNFYIDGTMPQAGIDPPEQTDVSYEASALPPSHHGWILICVIRYTFFFFFNF